MKLTHFDKNKSLLKIEQSSVKILCVWLKFGFLACRQPLTMKILKKRQDKQDRTRQDDARQVRKPAIRKKVIVILCSVYLIIVQYAAVNGHRELPLLKDRQRFDAISMLNLEVYKFRDWWILTYFIFGHGESSPNNIWSMVNLERTCILLFYYFLCLKVNLDLEKTNQLGESSPNFIFVVVNLDPIILEKRWIDGESWHNDFFEKVNKIDHKIQERIVWFIF